MARLTLRIDLGANRGAIGPGKIRLLEAVREHGSISGAGRALGMSYRRAWLLIDAMNGCFREPVVETQLGGPRGGGAVLTAFGARLVADYRAVEAAAHDASEETLRRLDAACRGTPDETIE